MSSSDRNRETETWIDRRRQYYTDMEGNPAFVVDAIAVSSGDSAEQRGERQKTGGKGSGLKRASGRRRRGRLCREGCRSIRMMAWICLIGGR